MPTDRPSLPPPVLPSLSRAVPNQLGPATPTHCILPFGDSCPPRLARVPPSRPAALRTGAGGSQRGPCHQGQRTQLHPAQAYARLPRGIADPVACTSYPSSPSSPFFACDVHPILFFLVFALSHHAPYKPPITLGTARALAGLATAAGSSLTRYIHSLLPVLLDAMADNVCPATPMTLPPWRAGGVGEGKGGEGGEGGEQLVPHEAQLASPRACTLSRGRLKMGGLALRLKATAPNIRSLSANCVSLSRLHSRCPRAAQPAIGEPASQIVCAVSSNEHVFFMDITKFLSDTKVREEGGGRVSLLWGWLTCACAARALLVWCVLCAM